MKKKNKDIEVWRGFAFTIMIIAAVTLGAMTVDYHTPQTSLVSTEMQCKNICYDSNFNFDHFVQTNFKGGECYCRTLRGEEVFEVG